MWHCCYADQYGNFYKRYQPISSRTPPPEYDVEQRGDSQASYPNRSKSEIWNEELSQGSISRIWVDSIISTHIYIIIIFTPTGRYERSVLPLWRCWTSHNLMSLGLISKEQPAAAVVPGIAVPASRTVFFQKITPTPLGTFISTGWYPGPEISTQNHAQSTALGELYNFKKNLIKKILLAKKIERFENFTKINLF